MMKTLLIAVVSAVVLAGCSTSTMSTVRPQAVVLEPAGSVQLAGPAAAMCVDGASIVVLEASGTRLIVLDSLLAPSDTVPLTERLAAPRGVMADRFYYYVYDDQALYRALKDELVLKPWLSNVRVGGLAEFTAGELLVSDAERNVVWYKTVFGEGRKFLDATAVADPGPIAALPGGRFCALDAGRRLVFFNRAGVVTRSVNLADRYDLLAADPAGTLYLGRPGSNLALVTDGARQASYELAEMKEPVGIAVMPGRLAVLDSGSRIVLYRLP